MLSQSENDSEKNDSEKNDSEKNVKPGAHLRDYSTIRPPRGRSSGFWAAFGPFACV